MRVVKGLAKKPSYHRDHGGHKDYKEIFSVISVRSVVKSFDRPTKLATPPSIWDR